jgi:hypothetical protein
MQFITAIERKSPSAAWCLWRKEVLRREFHRPMYFMVCGPAQNETTLTQRDLVQP